MKRYLTHSAQGSTWSKKNHKYIAIKNGRYIYPNEVSKSGYVARTMTSTPANLGRTNTNGVAVSRMSSTPSSLANKSKITSYYSQAYSNKASSPSTDRRVKSSSTVASVSSGSSSGSSGSGKTAKDYLADSIANSKAGKKEATKSTSSSKKTSSSSSSGSSNRSSANGTTISKASGSRKTYNPGVQAGHVSYSPNRNSTPVARNFIRNTAGARASRGSTDNRGYSIRQLRGLSSKVNGSSKSEGSANQSFVNNNVDQSKIKNGVNEANKISEKVITETEKQNTISKATSNTEKDMKKSRQKKKGMARIISNSRKKLKEVNWNSIDKSKTIINNLLRSR